MGATEKEDGASRSGMGLAGAKVVVYSLGGKPAAWNQGRFHKCKYATSGPLKGRKP